MLVKLSVHTQDSDTGSLCYPHTEVTKSTHNGLNRKTRHCGTHGRKQGESFVTCVSTVIHTRDPRSMGNTTKDRQTGQHQNLQTWTGKEAATSGEEVAHGRGENMCASHYLIWGSLRKYMQGMASGRLNSRQSGGPHPARGGPASIPESERLVGSAGPRLERPPCWPCPGPGGPCPFPSPPQPGSLGD